MTKDGLSVNECEHVPLKFKFSTCNTLPPTFWVSFEQNTRAILPKCVLDFTHWKCMHDIILLKYGNTIPMPNQPSSIH